MANNLFAGRLKFCVSKQTISFSDAGLNSGNTAIIFQDDPFGSFVPDREINAISGFVSNKGYYVIPLADMDLSSILAPPNAAGGGIGAFTVS